MLYKTCTAFIVAIICTNSVALATPTDYQLREKTARETLDGHICDRLEDLLWEEVNDGFIDRYQLPVLIAKCNQLFR